MVYNVFTSTAPKFLGGHKMKTLFFGSAFLMATGLVTAGFVDTDGPKVKLQKVSLIRMVEAQCPDQRLLPQIQYDNPCVERAVEEY